jgi:hypothetical protein
MVKSLLLEVSGGGGYTIYLYHVLHIYLTMRRNPSFYLVIAKDSVGCLQYSYVNI